MRFSRKGELVMPSIMRVFALVSICSAAFAQLAPLSQKDACSKFSGAVVRIDTGRPSSGTGFIVSPDGLIFTAAHVVRDPESGEVDEAISITLPDGSIKLAAQVLKIDPNLVGRDYALLKVEGTNLHTLDLGDKPEQITLGSDLTIIGFPFSAGVKDKFCLSGIVAYSGQTEVPVRVQTPKSTTTVNVSVDVIYFQGPSVQGLSGAPIISRDSGHVIAILTSKLTGINESLAKDRKGLIEGGIAGLYVGGVHEEGTIKTLIDTLESQLANGLGAGTGIEDAKAAMRHALRQRKATQK
jgi:S1-C subfamily serine protease